jgi:hypothetical protein
MAMVESVVLTKHGKERRSVVSVSDFQGWAPAISQGLASYSSLCSPSWFSP